MLIDKEGNSTKPQEGDRVTALIDRQVLAIQVERKGEILRNESGDNISPMQMQVLEVNVENVLRSLFSLFALDVKLLEETEKKMVFELKEAPK